MRIITLISVIRVIIIVCLMTAPVRAFAKLNVIHQGQWEFIVELEIPSVAVDTRMTSATGTSTVIDVSQSGPLGRLEGLQNSTFSRLIYIPRGHKVVAKMLALDERKISIDGDLFVSENDQSNCKTVNRKWVNAGTSQTKPFVVGESQTINGVNSAVVSFVPLYFDSTAKQLIIRKKVVVQFKFERMKRIRNEKNLKSLHYNELSARLYLNNQMHQRELAPKTTSLVDYRMKSADASASTKVLGIDNALFARCGENPEQESDLLKLGNKHAIEIKLLSAAPNEKHSKLCRDCNVQILFREKSQLSRLEQELQASKNQSHKTIFVWTESTEPTTNNQVAELYMVATGQPLFATKAGSGEAWYQFDFVDAVMTAMQEDLSFSDVIDYVALSDYLRNYAVNESRIFSGKSISAFGSDQRVLR